METYRHVAVAVEDSPGSLKALAEARRMAELTGARLSVLHVTTIPLPPPYLGEGGVFLPDPEVMQDAALTWLRELVEAIPGAEPHVLQGHPPDAVCTWADENDVDLLVAGAERGKMQRLLLGSFAAHLARHASCDILLARPQKD
jgi:nucleotide-binding universal stress UspA family protein